MAFVFRLRASGEVRAVLKEGFALRSPLFIVRSRPGPTRPRLAVVASKKRVGNAVKRNRARRRIREAAGVANLPNGDYVIVASSAALTAPFGELVRAAKRAASR